MCACVYMDPGGEGEGLTERERERERERDAILRVRGRRADVSEGAGCKASIHIEFQYIVTGWRPRMEGESLWSASHWTQRQLLHCVPKIYLSRM